MKLRSRKLYWAVVVLLFCTAGLITATGYLGDQAYRSYGTVDGLRQRLIQAQNEINRLNERDSICTTKECVASAHQLLESMDTTADPCQDFYQFACGGWLKKYSIPDSSTRWGQFDIIRQRVSDQLRDILRKPNALNDPKPIQYARDMYAACLNTDEIEALGLQPLIHLLDLYGQWPMTLSDWSDGAFDWRRDGPSIRVNYGDSYLFSIYNHADSNDTDKSTLYVDQTGIGLSRPTLLGAQSNSTVINAYSAYMSGVAKAIRNAIHGGATDSDIEYDVSQVIAFQIELAKIQTPPEERRNKTRMYNAMTIAGLQQWTDQVHATHPYSYINWLQYINNIYSAVDIHVIDYDKIIVSEPEFLLKLFRLLDRTPRRVIANYYLWRLVTKMIGETNQQMNSLAFKFSKVLLGGSGSQPRWRGCVSKVSSSLGFAVGAAYVETSFDEKAKAEMMDMINYLKNAFYSLVKEADWMDEETKLRALDKAKGIRDFVGYPDWIRNKTALEKAYKGVETSRTRHFENTVNTIRFTVEDSLKEYRKPTDRTTWVTFPSVVNAFYYFFYNSITFPAGILQIPFFGKGRLAALNYGAIGAVIGHEITHGFDDQGRQTDKDGRVNAWWTEETASRYLDRARCFIDQYSNYTFPEFYGTKAYRINGIISQGENIADNGGVRESFRAYKNYVKVKGPEPRLPGLEKFSSEQLFFLSYANVWCSKQTKQSLEQQILNGPHSPARYRVIGPLSNSVDFVNEFYCPIGEMNRSKKCVIW